MIYFDLPVEKSSILKVIGVGGGGSNAVNYMYNQQIEGVDFVICNTDAQALTASGITNRVQLGPLLTQGLGAGANPEIGRQATEESLEEIRKILEVNTKMVFITAGMGGGTGTGGAPIIAKICKDLGILTVGIVTTPFAYEGKKRLHQAEEGIRQLRSHVDTLLVISNDKLRHQFGNLKMREAFEKADNVLATAARCITDVINSTGQINVDFADVCTVMRNGGRAILGHAEVAGTHRAQLAIEEALNSPLLNDNEINGAKWILININSSKGEFEFTMDEVEVIQQYLLSKAGENTDVILGMGYDDHLHDKLGITLIATGFEHRDVLSPPASKKVAAEEKIIMVLGQQPATPVSLLADKATLVETSLTPPAPATETVSVESPSVENTVTDPLMPRLVEIPEPAMSSPLSVATPEPTATILQTDATYLATPKASASEGAAAGGYLVRPVNIYAEAPPSYPPANHVVPPVTAVSVSSDTPSLPKSASVVQEESSSIAPVVTPAPEEMTMQLIEKEEPSSLAPPLLYEIHSAPSVSQVNEEHADESMEQQRRAADRLQKLRNLSYNVNATDPNNEFETIPAYVRRNMELYNSTSQIENFYSNYEVKENADKDSPISRLNSFLNGKKPD